MNKIKVVHAVLAASAIFAACKNDKKETESSRFEIETIEELPGILDEHGKIGDGTSMNVLEFIKDAGDTLYVDMNSQAVMGGENIGDEVKLVYAQTDSTCNALIAVNLTALQHVWTQKGDDGNNQSLELNSNGRAATYNMSVDYDSWSVTNGTLLLHSPKKIGDESKEVVDTFDIMELTSERLVLSNGLLTTEFQCDN